LEDKVIVLNVHDGLSMANFQESHQ
jgi:hypothetical protein